MEFDTSTFLKCAPVLLVLGVFIGMGGRRVLKYLSGNEGMLTETQHDKLCALRLQVIKGDITHIKESVDRIEKHLNGGS